MKFEQINRFAITIDESAHVLWEIVISAKAW